jgi:hypothetical protein
MFNLHNEHRVFFTRLLALGLLLVNGQWDPRLQQAANAGIHALTAVLLVAILWTANERRRLDLLVLVAAMTFVPPFSWENTLQGFQSAFFFQELFCILALWLTIRHNAGSGPWYLGLSCALCSLFCAAGGVLTPLAIGSVIGLRMAGDRREWRNSLVTFGALVLVFLLGLATASPPLPQHALLKAQSVSDFFGALGRCLAWPWVGRPQLSVGMWLPLAVLLSIAALRRKKMTVLEQFIAGLGVWVVLQASAVAFGRGAGAPTPATRYQDFLGLGLVANSTVLLIGLDRTPTRTVTRRLAVSALTLWLLISAVGVDRRARVALTDLSWWAERWSAQASTVRRLVLTGNLGEFTASRPADLPYPDAQALARVLHEPYIRRILPAGLRHPEHVEPRVVTNDAFVPDGIYPSTPRDALVRVWGSYTSRGNPAQGRFESWPLGPCELGRRLDFQVAGYLGLADQYLAVKDLGSGRETEVRPLSLAREDWMNVSVPCPIATYAIIADDARPDFWFAFREPVEVGQGSVIAESLIAASINLLLVALMMAVLAARLA